MFLNLFSIGQRRASKGPCQGRGSRRLWPVHQRWDTPDETNQIDEIDQTDRVDETDEKEEIDEADEYDGGGDAQTKDESGSCEAVFQDRHGED